MFFDDVVVSVDSAEQAPVNQDQYFVYGPSGLLLGEYDSQNQPLLEHVYLGSTLVAVIKGEDVCDVHADHLDTPRVISSPQESGLFYNWFQTLNPKTDRYLESDPIGLFGGLNPYGYVEGNPLKF